ncbi:hypothetical protein GCM10009092_01870 [Bowmanella denitrificans]|uniref:Uncharacterized protein n=1 Tax=Bowmanella denitrificans TaxID=366582 RepID=A0ABN0WL60_9ALTE
MQAELDTAIQLNSRAAIEILQVGREQTPVVVIDDFALDIQAVIAHASQQTFTPPSEAAYPGVRAPLPRPYIFSLLDGVFKLIYQLYRVPAQLRMQPQNFVYSLVSQTPEQLSSRQRLPHYDSHYLYHFALMHYLNPGPHGGTAFYRHKPTGFETISQPRRVPYIAAVQAHMAGYGEPDNAYIHDSTDQFEQIGQVAYRPNRLLIYPGFLLHSGLIDTDSDIDSNPVTGRLTANLFIEFR